MREAGDLSKQYECLYIENEYFVIDYRKSSQPTRQTGKGPCSEPSRGRNRSSKSVAVTEPDNHQLLIVIVI